MSQERKELLTVLLGCGSTKLKMCRTVGIFFNLNGSQASAAKDR